MVLVIGMICFVYAIIQLIQMLSELKAFRQKDDISIITFFIPILNLIKMWQLPEKVLEAKRMVVGHTPQLTGEVLDLGHVVCIDTACVMGGWLTAIEVKSRQVWQADREGGLRE